MSNSKKHTIIIFVLLCFTYISFAQTNTWELHVNVNEIYPTKNSDLTFYPVLWYDSDNSNLLVGGFSAGISLDRPLTQKFSLLSQLSLQRSRFRDNPTIFADANGAQLGAISGINTSYSANLFTVPYLNPINGDKLSLGIGLGLRAILSSVTYYGETFVNGEATELKFDRSAAAPVVLYLPLRLRYQLGKIQLEAGFDYDISNASRLADVKEKYFTLQAGISYRLNQIKEEG